MGYALLTIAMGAVSLWMARHIFTRVRGARGWPTVPGAIVERGVGGPMGTPGRSYLPRVKYTYAVAGTQYTSDQVYTVGRVGGSVAWVRRLVDGLPDPVPVHYDPRDPTRSYLLVNPAWPVWVLVVFGGVLLVVGLLKLFVVLMGTQG
jgi:hypothetical protein